MILLQNQSALAFSFTQDNKNGPIEINSDNGISCDQESNVCTAKGNVLISQKDSRLRAQEVIVHIKKSADGKQQMQKVEAKGGVIIDSIEKAQQLEANNGFYDITTGYMEFHGPNITLTFNNIKVEAKDKVTFSEKEMLATAYGDAKITQDGRSISSDVLQAKFKKNNDGKIELIQMNARSKAALNDNEHILIADRSDYNQENGEATAVGNVEIIRKNAISLSDEASYSTKNKAGSLKGGSNKQVKLLLIP
jgi:lipopolysaccharide transport protein LptA